MTTQHTAGTTRTRVSPNRRLDYSRIIGIAQDLQAPVPATKRVLVEADDTARLANAFHKLIDLEAELWQVQGKLGHYQWQRDTADVLDVNAIDRRVKELIGLTEQLSMLLDQRATFLNLLKQPYTGSHIIMAPSEQRAFVELFEGMARSLSQYAISMDISTWLKDAPLFTDTMMDELSRLSAMVTTFSSYTDMLASTSTELEALKSNNNR
ncbi:hypothetical protein BDF22DRAFT_695802 [Syncephalis plumigaleata]|nr:hypothetical protein BDF22DRAFT_695802 [Syncephalis plumigaleata]